MNTKAYFILTKNKIKYKYKEIQKSIRNNDSVINQIEDENGIFPIVQGGLGNQIFIIVAGYIVSRNLRCKLYILNNPSSKHNFLKNDYNKSIFKLFGTHISKDQDYVFINSILEKGYIIAKNNQQFRSYISPNFFFKNKNYFDSKITAYSYWDFREIHKKTIMIDYYQYYPPIKYYEEEIQNLLINGLEEYINKIKNTMDTTNSAFIHVRRGDYLDLSNIYLIQPISYYESSYNSLIQKNNNINKIYILSNDFGWVKEQDFFKNIPNKEYYEVENELEVLALMTLCTFGAICANSTFSWWGAFLGTHKANNPVYVPSKWINTSEKINLFPSTWNIFN